MTLKATPHLLLLCTLLFLPPLAGAAAAEPASPRMDSRSAAQDEGAEPVERLKAWPKLESKSKSSKEVARLRKASTEKMGTDSAAALRAMGAGAAPLLIQVLGKERDEKVRARLIAVLDEITAAAHTRLLAQSFSARSEHVRLWSLGRCAALPDAGNRDAAEQAFATCIDPQRRKKASADETYMAALCATAAGSLRGMRQVESRAIKSWKTYGREVRKALEQVRGAEASALLLPRLADAPRSEAVTLMHMLAGCGESSATAVIGPFLDNSDNSLRVAAINALRGIVDGEAPLDKLPVFRAIELAREWKARL